MESSEAERPFPGARRPVPGMHRLNPYGNEREAGVPVALPLESSAAAWERGWVVRLPVRAEQIAVDRQVVLYERVVIGRRELDEVARVDASVRREELRVDVAQAPRRARARPSEAEHRT